MGHFANVVDGLVVDIITAEQDFIDTLTEGVGEWIQTSYNTTYNVHLLGGEPLRYNYARIGHVYDSELDAFYDQSPFPSWILDSNCQWQPPIEYQESTDTHFNMWDEDTLSWVLTPIN